MDLRLLRYFTAVAHAEHFTRAADTLGVAQPAVSQRIRELERSLGVKLFDRTSRRVELTAAGLCLLGHATRILDATEVATCELRAMRSDATDDITIASISWLPCFDIATILQQFRTRHPDVKVHVRERTTSTMIAMLLDRQIDLAVVQRPSRPQKALEVTDIAKDEFVLITPTRHRLSQRRRVRASELADEDFVTLEPGSGVARTLTAWTGQAGFEPRIVLEAMHLDTVHHAVAADIGIALVPRSRIDAEDQTISVISTGPPALVRPIAIAHRREPLRPAAAALKATVVDMYGAVPTSALS